MARMMRSPEHATLERADTMVYINGQLVDPRHPRAILYVHMRTDDNKLLTQKMVEQLLHYGGLHWIQGTPCPFTPQEPIDVPIRDRFDETYWEGWVHELRATLRHPHTTARGLRAWTWFFAMDAERQILLKHTYEALPAGARAPRFAPITTTAPPHLLYRTKSDTNPHFRFLGEDSVRYIIPAPDDVSAPYHSAALVVGTGEHQQYLGWLRTEVDVTGGTVHIVLPTLLLMNFALWVLTMHKTRHGTPPQANAAAEEDQERRRHFMDWGAIDPSATPLSDYWESQPIYWFAVAVVDVLWSRLQESVTHYPEDQILDEVDAAAQASLFNVCYQPPVRHRVRGMHHLLHTHNAWVTTLLQYHPNIAVERWVSNLWPLVCLTPGQKPTELNPRITEYTMLPDPDMEDTMDERVLGWSFETLARLVSHKPRSREVMLFVRQGPPDGPVRQLRGAIATTPFFEIVHKIARNVHKPGPRALLMALLVGELPDLDLLPVGSDPTLLHMDASRMRVQELDAMLESPLETQLDTPWTDPPSLQEEWITSAIVINRRHIALLACDYIWSLFIQSTADTLASNEYPAWSHGELAGVFNMLWPSTNKLQVSVVRLSEGTAMEVVVPLGGDVDRYSLTARFPNGFEVHMNYGAFSRLLGPLLQSMVMGTQTAVSTACALFFQRCTAVVAQVDALAPALLDFVLAVDRDAHLKSRYIPTLQRLFGLGLDPTYGATFPMLLAARYYSLSVAEFPAADQHARLLATYERLLLVSNHSGFYTTYSAIPWLGMLLQYRLAHDLSAKEMCPQMQRIDRRSLLYPASHTRRHDHAVYCRLDPTDYAMLGARRILEKLYGTRLPDVVGLVLEYRSRMMYPRRIVSSVDDKRHQDPPPRPRIATTALQQRELLGRASRSLLPPSSATYVTYNVEHNVEQIMQWTAPYETPHSSLPPPPPPPPPPR